MTIHRPAWRAATRKKLTRRLSALERMLVAMANGAALHRGLSSKAERSWLTDGTPVRGDVAAPIIARPAVVGVGDALPLFRGEIASQAWRFVRE